MENKKKNYPINLAIVGDSGVGKTSFINRILGKNFNPNIVSTIGIYVEYLVFENKQENCNINIKIWDTAGQEQFRATIPGIVKKADIIIFIRDNKNNNIDRWLDFLEENVDIRSDDVKMIFCLNKTDLLSDDKKEAIHEELLNKAQEYKASVFKFSAKNDNDFENIKLHIQNVSLNLIKKGLNTLKNEMNICLIGPSKTGKTSLIERIINKDFIESTILTTKLIKNSCHVDLKNHCNIKYYYYDIPGQEKYLKEELTPRILKKIDLIIFVNDNEQKEIETKILMQKINSLKEKNIIFCINKLDLIQEKEVYKNDYVTINKKFLGKNEPIFVSAKNDEGIDELKDKINYYANIKFDKEEENNENSSSHQSSLTRSFNSAVGLEDVNEDANRTCCEKMINFFKIW